MNPTMKRGALIGCGFFARNHLHAWRQLAAQRGVAIAALCDTDVQRLNLLGDEFGIERRYSSAAQLLAQEKLDFVDIATTAPSHLPLVRLAVAARVPVVCQKPLAPSLDEARLLVAACRDARVPLMVHENFRWQTPVQTAHKLLQAGEIGRPFWARVSFRSAFDVFSGQPYLATEPRFILQDLGVHLLDIARCLFGEVRTLSASTQRINPAIRAEDVATLLMTHESGLRSVVDCSYATALPEERFPQTLIEVDGSEGTLRLDAACRITLHHRQRGTRHVDASPPMHTWSEAPWQLIQDSVLNIQAHWLDCLDSGLTPQTSGVDNLQTVGLVEAAYASAAEDQRAVIIAPVQPA